jgi:hypothetical protein
MTKPTGVPASTLYLARRSASSTAGPVFSLERTDMMI